jgi:hypothetical protein
MNICFKKILDLGPAVRYTGKRPPGFENCAGKPLFPATGKYFPFRDCLKKPSFRGHSFSITYRLAFL